MVLLIVAIQVLMTYIGGRVLRTAPLTAQESTTVVVISLTMVVVDLLRKIIRDQVFGHTDPTNK